MKIKMSDLVTIEFFQEELEALYQILKGPNTASAWKDQGCTDKQIVIGCHIYAMLRTYLGKS